MTRSDRRSIRSLRVDISAPQQDSASVHQLYRLIYTSAALSPEGDPALAQDGLNDIAHKASMRNAEAGLSGALIKVQDHFIQVLEGEYPALEQVFEAICRDMRHSAVKLVDFSVAGERLFAEWGMVPLDAAGLENAEEVEDLFMGICTGMAPDEIIREIRGLLDVLDGRTAA